MPRLKRYTEPADFISEPRNAHGRMAQNTRGEAGFLDFRISIHDPASSAQIYFGRSRRPAARYNARRSRVIRNGVKNLARVLDARVDDLD